MGRHKEMIGTSYEIIYQDKNAATVDYTFLCPYCKMDTTVQGTITSQHGLDLINSGGFFEPLDCGHCGKTVNVRFWSSQKI